MPGYAACPAFLEALAFAPKLPDCNLLGQFCPNALSSLLTDSRKLPRKGPHSALLPLPLNGRDLWRGVLTPVDQPSVAPLGSVF